MDLVLQNPWLASYSKRLFEGFIQVFGMPRIKGMLERKGGHVSRERLWNWIKKNPYLLINSPYVQIVYPDGEVKKLTVEEALREMRARRARLHEKPSFLKRYRLAFAV